MIAILKKDFISFFASPIAYLVIGVFLVINGLFLWVFDDDFNILNAGFADVNNFFYLAPWLLLLLIPAITMKSFSDEYQKGTIETLLTKPITKWQIVMGKFWASFLLVITAIIPTFIYVYSVSELAAPSSFVDFGSVIGSYLGLFLLAAVYVAIGIYSSSLTNNQIVSFLVSLVISFFFFYGFDALSSLFGNNGYTIQLFGFNAHFKSLSRGVIDTRDVIYFLSILFFLLFLTKKRLDNV